MKQPGVAELKAHLSSYLKQVKGGREVLVTERGMPIAKLVPLPAAENRRSRRQRLAAAGLLHLGRGRIRRSFFPVPKAKSAGPTLLECLLEEREAGR